MSLMCAGTNSLKSLAHIRRSLPSVRGSCRVAKEIGVREFYAAVLSSLSALRRSRNMDSVVPKVVYNSASRLFSKAEFIVVRRSAG